MSLMAMLRDGLMGIGGVTLYCQDDLAGHLPVLSFNIDGVEASDTGTLLDAEYHIACRTGLHCAPLLHQQLGTDKIKGAVRFGVGPFNTEGHIRTAVRAVTELVSSGLGRPKAVSTRPGTEAPASAD
jgi:selenocysteine lyase/cysteine desulfurase